jgi:hypothetical protein
LKAGTLPAAICARRRFSKQEVRDMLFAGAPAGATESKTGLPDSTSSWIDATTEKQASVTPPGRVAPRSLLANFRATAAFSAGVRSRSGNGTVPAIASP